MLVRKSTNILIRIIQSTKLKWNPSELRISHINPTYKLESKNITRNTMSIRWLLALPLMKWIYAYDFHFISILLNMWGKETTSKSQNIYVCASNSHSNMRTHMLSHNQTFKPNQSIHLISIIWQKRYAAVTLKIQNIRQLDVLKF